MLSELFLYDRDAGLFKEMLKQDKVIEGRYHVSPNYGHDLNTGNLDSFLKDPAYGLTDPKQKYPICVCMTPKSGFTLINMQKWEVFYFHIFFLCLSQRTGDNQIKKVDRDTNTSGQFTWYDWNDMKLCASDFLEVLKKVIKTKKSGEIPLRSFLHVEFEKAVVTRLTKFSNDKVNGVSLSFIAQMSTDACTLKNYDSIDEIVIPTITD